MTNLPHPRRHGRGLGLLALAIATVAAVIAALFAATANSASAQATLTQVTSFGSNPGNLQMYSYVPTGLPSGAPLVVALHGCTQNATDYYDDSGWPQYASQWDFAVVFPQQQTSNNDLDCFDWYTSSADSPVMYTCFGFTP
jgi:poly(3-hydroxybutyrate) depolymerase